MAYRDEELDGLNVDDTTEMPFSPSEDSDADPVEKAQVDKEIGDESDDVEAELADSEAAAPTEDTVKEEPDDGLELASAPALDHLSMPALPGAKPKANPKLDKYQQFIDEYKRLQDNRRSGDLVTGLIAAGGKIGQSIAGKTSGNFTPDQSGVKLLQQMDERPVKDFEQQQVVNGRGMALQDMKDDHDPKSPKSVLIRNYLNEKLKMNLADDVSAADAQQLLKTIGKPSAAGTGMRFVNLKNKNTGEQFLGKLSKDGQMFDGAGQPLSGSDYVIANANKYMKDAHGNTMELDPNRVSAPPKIVNSSAYAPVEKMDEKQVTDFRPDQTQQKALQAEQRRMDTMTKAQREGIQSADKLDKILSSSNVYQGAALKTELPKLMGFNGRMSPLEQGMWTGSQAWGARAEQYLQTISEGTLTEQNKAAARDLLAQFKDSVNSDLANISEGSRNSLEQTYAIPHQFSAKALHMPTSSGTGESKHDPVTQKYADEHFKGDYNKANVFLEKFRKTQTAGDE